MLDYRDFNQKQNGKKETGWGCINEYFESLIKTFSECKRVLKDNGSLVININDSKNNGFYNLVPENLVIELDKIGFSLVDTYIWLKHNPQFYKSKGSVRSHEYIYHFVKKGCKNYHFDESWLPNFSDELEIYKYGKESQFPKLLSGFDARLKTIKTNVADTKAFSKQCAEYDLYFHNHGTFMEEIPFVFIKTLIDNSRPGVVLDPYTGSSTVAKVANDLGGHSFIGYETVYSNILASELKIFGDIQNKELRQVA
jgi:DNA modification methylase